MDYGGTIKQSCQQGITRTLLLFGATLKHSLPSSAYNRGGVRDASTGIGTGDGRVFGHGQFKKTVC